MFDVGLQLHTDWYTSRPTDRNYRQQHREHQNWLVIFNTSKTQLVTFHLHQGEPTFSPVTMNGCTLN